MTTGGIMRAAVLIVALFTALLVLAVSGCATLSDPQPQRCTLLHQYALDYGQLSAGDWQALCHDDRSAQ